MFRVLDPHPDDLFEATVEDSPSESSEPQEEQTGESILKNECSCHCCFEVLLDPTTLTCGHNFCRHCLALWWDSSFKTKCPECRENWEGFPKVNIQLRNVTASFFSEDVRRRKAEIRANPKICESLLAFQKYGASLSRPHPDPERFTAYMKWAMASFTMVCGALMLYSMTLTEVDPDKPFNKPIYLWNVDEVQAWLGQLGPWTQLYTETFQKEMVNGRFLLILEDMDFERPPFSIKNETHRRAFVGELRVLKMMGIIPPQNLWEYKAVYQVKSLLLLFALRRTPRLAMLCMFMFDYTDTFLPFLHTSCPHGPSKASNDYERFFELRESPTWDQWAMFLFKYCVMPYHMISEFAIEWMDVHFWTCCFILVNATMLTSLDIINMFAMLATINFRTLHILLYNHCRNMFAQGLLLILLWSFVPCCVSDYLFYWGLYFSPLLAFHAMIRCFNHQ